MKSLKTAVAAILIAGGTIAAFAFTKSDKTEVLSAQTELHWFSPGGSYLGEKTIEEQEAECPGKGIVCARGYDDENNGSPVGPLRYTAERN